MTKDGIISAMLTLILGVLAGVFAHEWLVDVFAQNPIAVVLTTLAAVLFGYFLCLLVHRKALNMENEIEQLRKKSAENDLYIKELEGKNEWLNNRLSEIEHAPTSEHDERRSDIDISELSRRLDEEHKFKLRMQGKI